MLNIAFLVACSSFLIFLRVSGAIEIASWFETEELIINNIDYYLDMEHERLSKVKRYFKLVEKESQLINSSQYFGNPINAFTLIKRLTTDLNYIEDTIKVGTEYKRDTKLKYPAREDLHRIIKDLIRIQEDRALYITDFQRDSLTVSDCYEIGQILYSDKDYRNGVAWMMEAYKKHIKNTKKVNRKEIQATIAEVNDDLEYFFIKERRVRLSDIVERISYGYHHLDDKRNAKKWLMTLVKIAPNHPHKKYHLFAISIYERNIIKENEQKLSRKDYEIPRPT